MNMGKSAFIVTLAAVTAAVCTTAGAQTSTSERAIGVAISHAPVAAPVAAPIFDAQQPTAPLGGGGAGHDPGCETCGVVSFTQSTNATDIIAGNSVACVSGAGITSDNQYWRGFTLLNHGVPTPFDVCGIQIGIEVAESGDGTGVQPITIRLYDTADPTLADIAVNLIGEVVTTIVDQTLSLECFSIAGTVESGGLTVEIAIPNSIGGDGHTFFIGTNPDPETATSYLSSEGCGILVPTPMADVGMGFPNAHIVMTVFGGGAGEKTCPEDTNGDGSRNVLDLIEVLLCFGQPAEVACATGQDINQDGAVNVLDLIDILLAFGQDCPPVNVLTVVCDLGSERPDNELCCDFDWTVTNNGPDPIDTFYLDLEAGLTSVPIRCETMDLPGWNATQCHPWGVDNGSNHSVWCFTGGVLLPNESASGTLNVEVNQQVGGSIVIRPGSIPFFVPEKAIHCHVTSVGPQDQTPPTDCVPIVNSFSPHLDANGNGAPDQSWSPPNNWVCFPKDVCDGAETIVLPPLPFQGLVSGTNNTTVGATVDDTAPVCPDEQGGAPVEITAPGNWYRVIGNGATLTATTCNERLSPAFDSAISVYSGECGSLTCVGNAGANILDLACAAFGFNAARVTWCSVDGVEYHILVHGANQASAGPYRLDIISDGVECSECDPLAGKTPEGEDVCFDEYDDIFNGGCNSDRPVFSNVSCGEAICGTYGTFIVTDPDTGDPIAVRDTDWYKIVTTVNTIFTWKVTGQCETLLGVVDNFGVDDCNGVVGFLEATVVGPSSRGSVTTRCLSPGTYWFFVAPGDFTGCECGSEYNALLTCVEGCVQDEDQCGGRIPIADGVATPFDTTLALTDGPDHPACLGADQVFNDIWFNYTAACDGDLEVTTCDNVTGGVTDFDTVIIVYDGCECVAGLEDPPLGCNDEDLVNPPCGGGQSTVIVPVVQGQCYKIRVGGFAGGDLGLGVVLATCGPADPGCPLVCDPKAGKTPEGEPLVNCQDEAVDDFNSGCDSETPVFSSVICGESICGTYGTYFVTDPDTDRLIADDDHDWYEITTIVDTIFTWTVTGQCDTLLAIFAAGPDPVCSNIDTLAIDLVAACTTGSVVSPCSPAGTYYFLVSTQPHFGCDCGSEYNATLTCVESPGCICEIVPVGGEVLENEANCGIPADTVNGGCNSTPIVFNSVVSCGQTVFGTSALVQGRRDTDWWLITLASPMSISWEVEAEFEFDSFILSGPPADCVNLVLEAAATGFACQPATATSGLLPAGDYILFVAPVFAQDDFACGPTYTGTVTCTP